MDIYEKQKQVGMPLTEYFLRNDIRKILTRGRYSKGSSKTEERLKQEFPYIEREKDIQFFGTEEYKKEFETRIAQQEDSRKVFGEFLGYPPSAVEWFVEEWIEAAKTKDPNFDRDVVMAVNYKGIPFITRKDLVEENLAWMEENIKLPDNWDVTVRKFTPRKSMGNGKGRKSL